MRRLLLLSSLALWSPAGCSGADDDPGLDALMRVSGAQFHRGALPAATSGPPISSFMSASSIIRPGELSAPFSGVVTRTTTSIALQLDGDPGYWIVTPGAEDATQLNQLTFSARVSFSPLLPEGSYKLTGRAADVHGNFGPASAADLMTAGISTVDTLLVSLRWDTEADLDLHLVIPGGSEIWANKINSYNPPPPGSGGAADAYLAGGILDYDSNSNCNIDGRRLENIYWTEPPPSGHYIARVDTFSLCGVPQADWVLEVSLGGKPLGRAIGTGRDSDAALPHGAMAGVTAFELDVP
jgi:hypothetical protein